MARPRKLFSYVVHHDFGLSPNPSGGYCTLAFCMFKKPHHTRRNVVELAEVGDWIVGTSGKSKLSFGAHGHLIYAMEVTEKLTLRNYFRDPRFVGRAGNLPEFAARTDMFALISTHFYYFGKKARPLAERHREYPIERGGRRYRSSFPADFVDDFERWVIQLPAGVNGEPCQPQRVEQVRPLGLMKNRTTRSGS